MKRQVKLVGIENPRKITRESDGPFLFEYERALLLALKEEGLLDEAQYRYAEGRLRKQLERFRQETGA